MNTAEPTRWIVAKIYLESAAILVGTALMCAWGAKEGHEWMIGLWLTVFGVAAMAGLQMRFSDGGDGSWLSNFCMTIAPLFGIAGLIGFILIGPGID